MLLGPHPNRLLKSWSGAWLLEMVTHSLLPAFCRSLVLELGIILFMLPSVCCSPWLVVRSGIICRVAVSNYIFYLCLVRLMGVVLWTFLRLCLYFPVSSALRGFRLSSSCCSGWFNAGIPDSETVEHGAWGSVLTPLVLQHEIVMKRFFFFPREESQEHH